MIDEQLDILRRIIDRLKEYGLKYKDTHVVDYAEHLSNELSILKNLLDHNSIGK